MAGDAARRIGMIGFHFSQIVNACTNARVPGNGREMASRLHVIIRCERCASMGKSLRQTITQRNYTLRICLNAYMTAPIIPYMDTCMLQTFAAEEITCRKSQTCRNIGICTTKKHYFSSLYICIDSIIYLTSLAVMNDSSISSYYSFESKICGCRFMGYYHSNGCFK